MEIELKLFATLREAVGQKSMKWDVAEGSTVGELLRDLVGEYPDLEIFDENDAVYDHVNILINGRNVQYLEGLETALQEDDTVGVFPPVEGG
jgi:molybdopterin synthase sulfur carrier subunit